jgi:hypothetical protein
MHHQPKNKKKRERGEEEERTVHKVTLLPRAEVGETLAGGVEGSAVELVLVVVHSSHMGS